MATKQKTSPEREALALAHEERRIARENLADAQAAVEKARQHSYDASALMDRLEAELEEASERDADSLVASINSGAGLAELVRPEAEIRRKIEEADREREAWVAARKTAEGAAQMRQSDVDWAQRRVESAAGAVIASHVDVSAMIADAEKLQADALAKRAELRAISHVTQGSDAARRIASFLALPWLEAEIGDSWRNRPGAARQFEAFEQLMNDPDAPLA